MRNKFYQSCAILLLLLAAWEDRALSQIPATIEVFPKVSTTSVPGDADDPAIWVHPSIPAQSTIIGTDKESGGGLYVWDMNGQPLQFVPLGRPNNVDVRYGVSFGGQTFDIAVTNLRADPQQIKVFKIDSKNGRLTDLTTSSGILTPELEDPYGICLYRRPSDGAVFVITSTQSGATENLHQYLLEADGQGKIKGKYLRAIGNNSIQSFVEGLVADDELGYVYASDEQHAIRKYYADPDFGNDDQIVAFATADGIAGDREGLAIYQCAEGTGYLVLSSQGNNTVKVYRREGDNGDPQRHTLITTIRTNGSTETDGLDITTRPTSEKLTQGFLVTHNAPQRQFNLYAWEDIAQNFLTICPGTTTVIAAENSVSPPKLFRLLQNFPNPFNPTTSIPFRLERAAHIRLRILNIAGQTVRLLKEGHLPAGDQLVQWDGRNDAGAIVPSGIYLVQLAQGAQLQTQKLILMK